MIISVKEKTQVIGYYVFQGEKKRQTVSSSAWLPFSFSLPVLDGGESHKLKCRHPEATFILPQCPQGIEHKWVQVWSRVHEFHACNLGIDLTGVVSERRKDRDTDIQTDKQTEKLASDGPGSQMKKSQHTRN
jgi:hypothetical protein